ncbi:hypothetical protein [Armatimonas sp.]|uniref:DUF6923 family protein n=1 Tax=Armatimonas sp. TaxID=1872638 RepID=UPI00286BE935|nr:hypothetical protein [Armatimonas sp.]
MKNVLRLLTATLVLATTISLAHAGTLYGISNGFGTAANNQIYQIDPATGTISNSFQVTLAGFTVTSSQALTAHPTTGVLYGVIQTSGPTTRHLVTIDPSTGVATQIGAFSGLNFASLAFKPDGTLIGVTGNSGTTPETLYSLSTVNATPSLLLALGNGADGETIAMHPNGLLYHSSGNSDAFFESVDLGTSTVTTLGHQSGEMFAMGYFPDTGQLLGSDIAGNFFSINIADGARTAIGTINSPDDNRGLAYVATAAAPEPGTLAGRLHINSSVSSPKTYHPSPLANDDS